MATTDPFAIAMARTLKYEGGYSEAGPTYMGIDRRYWPSWAGWKIVDDWHIGKIDTLQRDEALTEHVRSFYRVHFWDRCRGEEIAALDLDLACALFDFAVNSDPIDAARALQRALNRLNRHGRTYHDIAEDGRLGPQTMLTIRRQLQTTYGGSVANARILLLNCFAGERYIHFVSCPDHESWPGWFLRLRWSGG